jgi:hypothetical protein
MMRATTSQPMGVSPRGTRPLGLNRTSGKWSDPFFAAV